MDVGGLIGRFGGVRALVVGDVMLDQYVWGSAERLSPEAPVPVVRVRDESQRAGGAANTAVNLAALGARVEMAGVVGDDAAGAALLDELRRAGVDTEAVVVAASRPTTKKIRFYAQGQQLLRADVEVAGPLDDDVADALRERVVGALGAADVAVVSDYAKGVVSPALAKTVVAAAGGRPVVVDPKGTSFDMYEGATVLTPNTAELARVARVDLDSEAAIVDVARRLVKGWGGRPAVLVTRGPDGMLLVEPDDAHRLPTRARQVFDVTGAGDTVLAILAVGVVAGLPLRDAAALANCGAAVVVARLGAASVTPGELLEAAELGLPE